MSYKRFLIKFQYDSLLNVFEFVIRTDFNVLKYNKRTQLCQSVSIVLG